MNQFQIVELFNDLTKISLKQRGNYYLKTDLSLSLRHAIRKNS